MSVTTRPRRRSRKVLPGSRIQFAPAFEFLLEPLGTYRYRGLWGGRGGAKSWHVARALLIKGSEQTLRIGCFREFQTTIRQSVHQLLKGQIKALGMESFYHVQDRTITGSNGTEFIFMGFHRNLDGIHSLEGVNIAWIEEAQSASKESWETLIPTIRRDDSEIWATWNTAEEDAPTEQLLVKVPPPRSKIEFLTYEDNPFLPDVLNEEQETLRRRDPDGHAHVWMGEHLKRSDDQILKDKWRVMEFTPQPHWDGPYFGADWGFAQDPAILVKLWLADSRLYVEREAGGRELDMDQLATVFAEIEGAREGTIRADSARPETINEMNRRGFNVIPAPKWSGSVEDGITHLRSYEEIVVHPSCTMVAQECRLYRYKKDPKTGDVLRKIIDAHNHGIDATRYGLGPMIKQEAPRRMWFPGMDEDET